MGEAFGHGTGHGLGIEIHEDPRIIRRRPDVDDAAARGVAPGWSSPSNLARTFQVGAACGSKTTCWSLTAGVEVLTDVTTELIEI